GERLAADVKAHAVLSWRNDGAGHLGALDPPMHDRTRFPPLEPRLFPDMRVVRRRRAERHLLRRVVTQVPDDSVEPRASGGFDGADHRTVRVENLRARGRCWSDLRGVEELGA